MLRTLYQAIDGVVQLTLASSYSIGSGQVVLSSGGSKFTSFPVKFTMITSSTYGQGSAEISSNYICTGASGNTLTGVAVLAGSTDQDFPAGSYLEVRANAIDINSLGVLVAPLNIPGATGTLLVSAGTTSAPSWQALTPGLLPTTNLVVTQHGSLILIDPPVSGAVTINCLAGDTHQITAIANTTITLSNPPSSGSTQRLILWLIQGSGGSHAWIFSPAVNWGAAGVPVWSITAGKKDKIILEWNGASWEGSLVGLGF
jgi:hypothetical protein